MNMPSTCTSKPHNPVEESKAFFIRADFIVGAGRAQINLEHFSVLEEESERQRGKDRRRKGGGRRKLN